MEVSPINMELRAKLNLRVGDTVRVHQKITEKDKTRIQQFEGLVLARKHGTENGATFTVRRVSGGFGVEKVFPLYSPMIDHIEITKRSKTRRNKLYNIRRQAIKQISKRMKMMFVDIKEEKEEKPVEVVEEDGEAKEDVEVKEEKVEQVEEKSESKPTEEAPLEEKEKTE